MVATTAVEAVVIAPRLLSTLIILLIACAPSLLQARTVALVVSGLGGNPEYDEAFAGYGSAIADGLSSLEVDKDAIIYLDGSANRENLLEAFAMQAEKTADVFVLVLIGHGTYDAQTWRFNIKGPDLTTEDLVSNLNLVNAQQQLVVLATSASGALLDILSQPNRVVITATKSGGELNAVRFPEFLATAIGTEQADLDRNEILTVAEAFRFADNRTREYYETQKLLASEHARLSGDSAESIALAKLGALRDSQDNPTVIALLEQRLQLEQQFIAIKRQKNSLPTSEYFDSLESVLLELARLQQSIDDATGWSENDGNS